MHAVRRTRPRLVTNLKVTYRNERCSGIGYTLNLSMGGLFLQTVDPLAQGDDLELMFHVPVEGQRKPVRCSGRIVHLRIAQDTESTETEPGVGLEFQTIPQGAGELRTYLATRLGLPVGAVGEPLRHGATPVLTPGLADEIAPAAARSRPAAGSPGSGRFDPPATRQRGSSHDAARTERLRQGAPRGRGRPGALQLLRLAIGTAVVLTCLFILTHVLMKLRLIPWDLTSWSETRWVSDEDSGSYDEAALDESLPSRPRRAPGRSERRGSERRAADDTASEAAGASPPDQP
jgi:hypothetical protein